MNVFTSCCLESERSGEDMIVGIPLRYGEGPIGEALQVNPSLAISSSTNITWKSGPCQARVVVNRNIV